MYNKNFLEALFQQKEVIKYAKIIKLNIYEQPVEEITGRVISGNINLDGTSNVRRTCSLSIVAVNRTIEYHQALSSKFRLEIGVANNINKNYPNIIWFNYGIFVTTSFQGQRQGPTYQISLTAKDKMCLLNGECGGKFYGRTNFETYDYVTTDENNNEVFKSIAIPVKEIIQNLMEYYGNEPLHNIIIKDLDDYGLASLDYRQDENLKPYYLVRKVVENKKDEEVLIRDSETKCYRLSDTSNQIALKDLAPEELEYSSELGPTTDPTLIKLNAQNSDTYYVTKISSGYTAGYKITKLIYTKELIAEVGESITSILDKIVEFLQNSFEYFYDLDGHFVFQQKRDYRDIQISYLSTNLNQEEVYIDKGLYYLKEVVRYFNSDTIQTSISLQPDINNIKNDFSIWGTKKNGQSVESIYHCRYALHHRPNYYISLAVDESEKSIYTQLTDIEISGDKYGKEEVLYYTDDCPIEIQEKYDQNHKYKVDWREIIYQMAMDWYKYHYLDDFGPRITKINEDFFNGKTGYEPFYPDFISFWRDLYDPFNAQRLDKNGNVIVVYNTEGNYIHWTTAITEDPESLNFWIDFIESDSSLLDNYSIEKIGDRLYAEKNQNINGLYFRPTPGFLYFFDLPNSDNSSSNQGQEDINKEEVDYEYDYYNVHSSMAAEKNYNNSPTKYSAINLAEDLLYDRLQCKEVLSFSIIPQYDLQENDIIHITDNKINIDNDYIIQRITIPMQFNGLMQITALKVPMRLI